MSLVLACHLSDTFYFFKPIVMIIGTLREVKNNENRIGLTPSGVAELVAAGHRVLVQETAGIGSGYSDQDYMSAGAEMKRDPREIVSEVDMIVKVKEPAAEEYYWLDLLEGKTLFTYLHLSGVEKDLTKKLLRKNITAIAYETVEDEKGGLPLLAPMSEIAGVLAIQYAGEYLQKKYNGAGITMGHITGTDLAHTVVVGAGVAGEFATRTALGMGGFVTLFEIRDERIAELRTMFDELFGPYISKNIEILKPEAGVYDEKIAEADVLVGAVLVKGARAPEVVSEEQIRSMKRGAVIVDISIDQGGCLWGSRPTTHENPTYEIEGKIYCSVTNMPGQVARQSTQALTSTT
ncbi:MAG: alanine dehydrogenase, partial [Candidatus Peregrinibacteria bacterium]|nr:alanine dehydrogenase [Candidatus Peregrinibacteria bacterium]